MEPLIAKPLFPSILALFCAVFSCIFTPSPVVPVPSLPPRRRSRTHGLGSLARGPSARLTLSQSTLKRPSTPLGRDKTFLADSDTTMRPMRPPSALENPSPATTLPPSTHPFALLSRHSPDTKLPPMRPHFPSWFRYNHETMRQISATKNFATATVLVSSATNTPPRPLFSQLRNAPGCNPSFQADSDTTTRQMRPPPPRRSLSGHALSENAVTLPPRRANSNVPRSDPQEPVRRGGNPHV